MSPTSGVIGEAWQLYKAHWRHLLTFPHFDETVRGEYLTEDQCVAICTHFQAKHGAEVKADVFRLAYLLGIRKGQLRRTCKRHVSSTRERGSSGGPRRKPRAARRRAAT